MKVQYKNLKKKESVISLIKKHDYAICGSLIFAIVAIIISIGGYIVSMVENVSFGMGILDFVAIIGALLIVAFFLYLIANYVWRAFTYVRMFFRYTYLPLTIEEAKSLGIDNSPVLFFKALKEMMTYYYFFDDIKKTIKDDETEQILSHLFYQLFFYKDETQKPLILEWLNNEESRKELKDAMKFVEKERYCADREYSLLDPLLGFFKMLEFINIYKCEIVDAVAFESDRLNLSYIKAILQYKDDTADNGFSFAFVGNSNVFMPPLKSCKTIDELVNSLNNQSENDEIIMKPYISR